MTIAGIFTEVYAYRRIEGDIHTYNMSWEETEKDLER